jgi:hypothetical protein
MNEKHDQVDFHHEALHGVVSMDKVLFAVVMTLFIGFSIGAGLTILGTSRDGITSVWSPSDRIDNCRLESNKERKVNCERNS